MQKPAYSKPEVLSHQLISFETGISNCVYTCEMPGYGTVCVKQDGSWEKVR